MYHKQTWHHTQSVSPEKNKYVTVSVASFSTTVSDASEASTLELGGFGGHSEPPQAGPGQSPVGGPGGKAPRKFYIFDP